MNNKNLEKRHLALVLKLEGKTYQQVGSELGISRQRVQQLLRPPTKIWNLVYNRANGKCESCGIIVGYSGHIHHKGNNGENYQDTDQLELLCIGCHRKIHKLYTQRDLDIMNTVLMSVDKRNQQIKELAEIGLSMAKIGRKFGISRQRVYKIIKRNKGENKNETIL